MSKFLSIVDSLGSIVVGTLKKVFTVMLLTAVLASLVTTSIILIVAKAT